MTKHVEIVEASLFRIKVFKVFRDENPLREQKTLLNEGFFSEFNYQLFLTNSNDFPLLFDLFYICRRETVCAD